MGLNPSRNSWFNSHPHLVIPLLEFCIWSQVAVRSCRQKLRQGRHCIPQSSTAIKSPSSLSNGFPFSLDVWNYAMVESLLVAYIVTFKFKFQLNFDLPHTISVWPAFKFFFYTVSWLPSPLQSFMCCNRIMTFLSRQSCAGGMTYTDFLQTDISQKYNEVILS